MSDLIQVTIKDLLKQISDRANHGREERMQASLELCRTLERLRNLQELPKGWQELGDDFLVIITARSGPLELKKNLSTCLAALGVLTGWEYELFIQWLLDAIEALHRKAEEERMMLIGAMASSIVVNATKSFPFAEKLSDKLMKFAIKSLEANTSHQVHSSLMELCTAVSQFSPTKFRAFFEDMVDLTVGWLMDETVPKKIHAKCEEALLGLSSFWLERPNYAKELMKQFRRDIVEDLEDLRNGGITGKEAQTVLSRAGSLIKTHAIIMRIYLNAPNEENLRIVIVSTIEELILAGESYISIFRVNDSNPTKLFLALVYVFELISELRAIVEEDFLKLTTSCVAFLFKVIDSFPGAIYLINGYLDLLTKFESNVPHIDEVVNMSTTLIHGQTDVSNYSKIGLIYQFLANPSTIKASSRLISALLSEKNIKTIQATYTMVIKWIGDELASLQAAKNNSNFKEQLEIKNASIRLFCLLQSLEHLATIKNSFVVMMLQPSLFTFLTTLPLSDDTFLEGFPMEHHTLMRLLHLHCESHGFFVVNSSWIVAASPSPIHQNLTKNHAESQLKLLHALLLKGNRVTLGKTRKLCDEWLESLFNNLPDYSLPEVVNHRDFKELQVTLWSLLLENPKRIERLQSVLKILEVTASNDEETMISQVKQARTNVQKLNHEDSIRLWKKIPSRSYILSGVSITGWTDTEMTQKKANECRFSTEHFSIIITFLLHKQMPNLLRNENDTWIHETIAYLHSTITGVEKELLMTRWRWALAQTVNYCVENRMRTQFGGPMETFSEFSKEIHRLAKEAISEIPNNKVEEKTMKSQPSVSSTTTLARRPEKSSKDEGNEVKEPRALNASEDWWRVRLLLEFVDLLDKAIYSAHTGASFSPFNVSEISRHFFIQNANACQEWLSRNYIPAMAVAYTAGAYAQVIRFGASALLDFERKQKKEKAGNNRESPNEADSKMNGQTMPGLVLMALQWITKAMVQLGYELPILGLAGWTQRVYAIVPEWLPICADIAAARWESSIAKLRTYLIQKNSDVEAKFAREMMLFCVLRVRLPELVSANHCPPDLSMWDVMSDSTNDAMFPECPPGFEESAFNCCRDLCVFGKVDTVPVYSNTAWKIPEKSLQIEHTLLTTMRRPEVLDIETQLANDAALVLATEGPLRLHTRFAIVQAIARLLATRMQKKGPELQDVHASIIAELDPAFILEKPKSDLGERVALGRQLLLWTERLGGPAYIESHVQMARLCRKTSNHMLTASHLMRAASNPNYARSSFNQIMVARQGAKMLWPTATFEQRAQHFVGLFSLAAKAYEMDLNQRVNGETFSPTSTRSSEVLLQLPNGNTIPVDPFNASAPVTTGGLATAKAAMLLAKWLGNEPDLFGTLPPEAAQLVFMNHLGVLTQEIGSIDWVGALLSMATKCAPTIAKSHEQLAQWALSQASLQSFISDQAFFVSNYSRLLGPEIATPERLEALWKAIFSSNSLAQLQNAVIVALGGTFASAAEILLKQTVYYTNMWGKMLERRRQLMTMGANSLFAFLRHHDRGMRTSIGTVRVCLQILDLLAHHQDIIHSILENGIQSTDVSLWVSVLPQVFARLSHPSRKVRETLIELIQRIGKISPHTVVYQIVVGASKQMLMDAETEDLVETNDEIAQDTHLEEKSLMFECCRRLEESLASFYPEMVSDVRSFVEELQKINLLLEERWVFVLANIDNEMEKRLTHIRAESEKTLKAAHLGEKERIELVQEKTRLITNSVFELLDDLYERTLNRTSTSVNEKSFIDEHKEKIAAAFETSRANRANPEKAWAPFRQLLAALIQKTARRTNSTLQIEDISEKLSKLNGSKVPIPGQEAIDFAEICYLDRLGKTAWVLPTKTRPKKLILIGSNGKENIFLFKGQEDLHLDERIMQLLHICNLMLRGAKELQGDWPLYEALNYSVTPLGARSGLIQWVIGCTPLFQLYRRWQNRQAQTKTLLNRKAGQATLNNNAPLERPTDMFMKKLRASFKENTIAPEVYGDRSKWPKTILRDVLLELMKETPNDLLAKELWMRAGSADTWWRVTSRMARSSAVMSIIGAILGLGDRHLDNLLVNLDSGQMVHIDYNVCFDKGRHLRVPETVPFRLTPNIVHALGPTQIDGMFQQSCQQALDVFRTGKKVLLTVLDAFVYDPLVDWAAAHDHLTTSAAVGSVNVAVALAVYGTDSRAAGARPIARQMFAVRVREFATPWKENKIELTQAIQHLIATINYEVKLDVQSPLEEAHALQKSRNEALQRMKAAIHAHHQIMKNFRQLLRALSACDPRFSAYTKKYRERFADGVVKAHEAMESIPSNFLLAITVLSSVVETINDVYDGLLSLDSAAPIVPAQSSTISPTNFMAPPGFEDTTPGEQQKQQQNLYARSVNRKVEARLDGRIDGNEPMKCFTIQEQVDQWIRSATSLSNLSLMYEGWTAWV